MRVAILALALLIPSVVFAAPININTATVAQLDVLKGIGPSKAQAIVDYRTKHGPFKTVEEIQNVSGIGPATFANIKADITVGEPAPAPAPTPQPTPAAPMSPPASGGQPAAPKPSSNQVQKVEPITSPTPVQSDVKQVTAPTAPVEPAAVGALPPAPASTGFFHSFWTLGLIGVIVLASGAFIFL